MIVNEPAASIYLCQAATLFDGEAEPSSPGKARRKPHLRKIDLDKLRSFAAAGLTPKETAAAIGCSPHSVYTLAKKHNIALKRDPKSPTIQNEFWLKNDAKLRRLIDGGATSRQVAAAVGVTKNAVIGRANRLQLIWARSPVPYEAKPRSTIEFPRHGLCVWPGMAEGYNWCGKVAAPDLPYCHEHCRRAYRQTEPIAQYFKREAKW